MTPAVQLPPVLLDLSVLMIIVKDTKPKHVLGSMMLNVLADVKKENVYSIMLLRWKLHLNQKLKRSLLRQLITAGLFVWASKKPSTLVMKIVLSASIF